VRNILAPDWQQLLYKADPKGVQEMVDNLASIIMACPNLERLTGIHLAYNHQFDRLTHALATRRCLEERMWIVDGNKAEVPPTPLEDDSEPEECSYPTDPRDGFAETFIQYHSNWSSLETLVLHGNGSSGLNFRAFVAAFRNMRALKHLALSNFESEEFNDRTLMGVPAVQSLRLENLSGLTDKGLSRFADSVAVRTLRSFAAIDLEIRSIQVLRALFKNMSSVRKFSLVQDASPELPPGALKSAPIFASKTLEFLHWDILIPGRANQDMASSIASGGFPSLQTIRAPSDHDGFLQDQCRQIEQVAQLGDNNLAKLEHYPHNDGHYLRSLPTARRAAQERNKRPRRQPYFKIYVSDEEGKILHTHSIRLPLGASHSNIEYSLESDIEGSNRAVADVADLVDPQGHQWSSDVCTGSWNQNHKLGSKWWSHAPKKRYEAIELSTLF